MTFPTMQFSQMHDWALPLEDAPAEIQNQIQSDEAHNVVLLGVTAFAVEELTRGNPTSELTIGLHRNTGPDLTQRETLTLDDIILRCRSEEEQYQAGATYGRIESDKGDAMLCPPVSGRVVAFNHHVFRQGRDGRYESVPPHSDVVRDAPHESWFVAVQMEHPEEFEALMTAGKYEEYCADSRRW